MSVKVKFRFREGGPLYPGEITWLHPEDEEFINRHGIEVLIERLSANKYAMSLELKIIDPVTEKRLKILKFSSGRSGADTIKSAVVDAMDYYDPRTKTWKV